MSYIVRLNRKISYFDIMRLKRYGLKVEFISRVLPIIIVEKDIPHIENLNFIESIRPEAPVRLLSKSINLNGLSPRPPLNEHLLRSRGYVGWNTVIAMIDSGINNVTGTLNINRSIDFTGTKTSSDGSDLFGHGTTVAYMIDTFAPRTRYINLKVTNSLDVKEGNIIKAMEWAYLHPRMNIINMSLGASRDTPCDGTCELCQFSRMMQDKGVLVVASAGNDGPNEGTITCPGNAKTSLTVGSIDINHRIAAFSGRGYRDQDKPDLVTSGYNNSPDPRFASGTSFSAPIVSGVAAAVYNECPDNVKLKELLCKSTIDLRAQRNHQGFGYLDLSKLLEVLDSDKVTNKGIQN